MSWINPPCPYLPPVNRAHTAADLEVFGRERGAGFYLAALTYAQSLWQQGFPAKSILLCNRALSAPITDEEPVLGDWPLPYQALAWILLRRPEGQFLGNPRRHWQHLASRMVEPHKELRTWRAWACWYLACQILPETEFPADARQIREEGLVEPMFEEIFARLANLSRAGDVEVWQHALHWTREQLGRVGKTASESRIRIIPPEELGTVIDMARRIWRSHYPGIISISQIEYMLAVWYEEGAMRREMSGRGVTYALIEEAGHGAVGYLAFEPQPDSQVLFLSKLYVLPERHGLGLGRMALEWVITQARQRASTCLRLRVNKSNTAAIRAYLRAGFRFVEDISSDIGNGFVMDDHLMEHPLRV